LQVVVEDHPLTGLQLVKARAEMLRSRFLPSLATDSSPLDRIGSLMFGIGASLGKFDAYHA
jgi:hypothetical protein